MQYIHSARWINQLKDSEHEVFVFDCLNKKIHHDLRWTNFTENWSKRKVSYLKGEYFFEKNLPKVYDYIEPFLKVTASEKLYEIINEVKPDLVHSLEMQSETYPLLKVRKKTTFNWAYFSWGSDLYLYQNNKKHHYKLKNVLKNVKYLFTDNRRDINLAKNLGFTGFKMPVFPGGGGYYIEEYQKFSLPVKERKLILIKGYNHWAGQALSVLNALEIIIEDIRSFDIYVYSAHKSVVEKIKEINNKFKINIEYSSRYCQISHKQLLEKFGRAKIAIGNNISDGIPNTLLEAIICGAFPIQSNPGGVTEEYIKNGENGFLIENPENSNEIAQKIKLALNNDVLLGKAFNINKIISEKLEYSKIKKEVLEAYKKIEEDIK